MSKETKDTSKEVEPVKEESKQVIVTQEMLNMMMSTIANLQSQISGMQSGNVRAASAEKPKPHVKIRTNDYLEKKVSFEFPRGASTGKNEMRAEVGINGMLITAKKGETVKIAQKFVDVWKASQKSDFALQDRMNDMADSYAKTGRL